MFKLAVVDMQYHLMTPKIHEVVLHSYDYILLGKLVEVGPTF